MAERNFNKEVLPNNELWRRGGKLNQKRHIELTEEEKANIAECDDIPLYQVWQLRLCPGSARKMHKTRFQKRFVPELRSYWDANPGYER
jgi:hypothetical protein